MSQRDPARLSELFDAACDLPEAALRAAFLDQHCAGDSDLRAHLERLLAADATARDEFLKNPALREHAVDGLPPESARQPATAPVLAAGERIGRYSVVEKRGHGGMGVVYVAYDASLDRKVALKILNERPDETSRARLLREARSLARVAHPNVVAVHEVGETDHGHLFLAMELVEGPTLRVWAQRRAWPEIVRAYLEAGRGLAAVHAAGLVHRDFKAENVLIDGHGRARVADFGLAALADPATNGRPRDALWSASERESAPKSDPHVSSEDVLKSPLTRTGTVVGTPRYMAPEVARKKGATRSSDQYSFSVALFETLYAQHPNEASDRVVRDGERRGPPDAVLSLLRRGLARDPADRHATMETLLDELATASGLVDSDSPRLRRQRLRVLVTILILAISLSIWVFGKGAAKVISTPRHAFLFSLIPTSVLAIAIAVSRRALLASRLNRQFVTVLALLCGALLGHRALELRFLEGPFEDPKAVLDIARMLAGDMLIFGLMLAVTSVFLGRRIVLIAVIALSGSIAAAFFPALAPNIFAFMMLSITTVSVAYWRAALRR